MTESKKWYQSKLVLLGLAIVFVSVTGLVPSFLMGQGVTPEQLLVLETQYPGIKDALSGINAGEPWNKYIGTFLGALIVIFRTWFTKATIQKTLV